MFLIGAKEMFAEEKWKDSQEPLIHITHFRYTYFSKIPVIGKGKWNIVQHIFHNRAVTHNINFFFTLLVIFRWVDSQRNDFGEEIPRTHLDCGGRAGAFHSKERGAIFLFQRSMAMCEKRNNIITIAHKTRICLLISDIILLQQHLHHVLWKSCTSNSLTTDGWNSWSCSETSRWNWVHR